MAMIITIHKWLVFVSGCIVMLIPMGIFYSLGALFVKFMSVFQASRTEASLVQSVAVSVSLSTGFIYGLLAHRFGKVKIGLFASCLATIGLAVSYFATSISFLVVSIGIAMAPGSICMYILSSAAVGQHFTGQKSLIMLSVVNACSGVGGMVFPFILDYLLGLYSLRGTLLICAGLVLNTIPCAMLWIQPERINKDKSENIKIHDKSSDSERQPETRSHGKDSESPSLSSVQQGNCHEANQTEQNRSSIPTSAFNRNSQNPGDTESANSHEDPCAGQSQQRDDSKDTETNYQQTENSANLEEITVFKSIKHLAKDKRYVLFTVGMAFSYPPIMVLITFIVDAFHDSGLTTDNANFGFLLLNAFGILGRLLPGVMMHSKYIKTMMVPIIASLVIGTCMAGFVLTNILSLKLVLLSLVGIAYGMFVSCFSVTSLDLVGSDHLGNAIGFAFSLNGLANIAAGPVSGYIRDSTGSYMLVFLVASGAQAIAVIMFVLAHRCQKVNTEPPFREEAEYYVTNL